MMSLAKMVGIDVPEIRLVDMALLQNLPPLNLPQEQYAFAIKRFDRQSTADTTELIHIEDFAQIFGAYPQQKYSTTNYEQIGKIIYQFSDCQRHSKIDPFYLTNGKVKLTPLISY